MERSAAAMEKYRWDVAFVALDSFAVQEQTAKLEEDGLVGDKDSAATKSTGGKTG